MTKKELRRLYKAKRHKLSQRDILLMDDLLLIQFQQWPLDDIYTVLSYRAISSRAEVDMDLMLHYLNFRIPGLRVAFPVINASANIFKPVEVDEDTVFTENEFGIEEPSTGHEIDPHDIDAVFVPLLAYDVNGYRVGYGKGFYDRFLATCREDVLKIGFSYFQPEPAIEDIDVFDVPLNLCITPNKLYEF